MSTETKDVKKENKTKGPGWGRPLLVLALVFIVFFIGLVIKDRNQKQEVPALQEACIVKPSPAPTPAPCQDCADKQEEIDDLNTKLYALSTSYQESINGAARKVKEWQNKHKQLEKEYLAAAEKIKQLEGEKAAQAETHQQELDQLKKDLKDELQFQLDQKDEARKKAIAALEKHYKKIIGWGKEVLTDLWVNYKKALRQIASLKRIRLHVFPRPPWYGKFKR